MSEFQTPPPDGEDDIPDFTKGPFTDDFEKHKEDPDEIHKLYTPKEFSEEEKKEWQQRGEQVNPDPQGTHTSKMIGETQRPWWDKDKTSK